jgi:hypothetical protein
VNSGGGGSMSRAATSAEDAARLAGALRQAEAALGAGDVAAADGAMAAAASLCRRLEASGLSLPDSERGALREIAEKCGREIARLGLELEADSLQDERVRRGLSSYRVGRR